MEEKIVKVGAHTLNLKGDNLFLSGVVKVKSVNETCFACALEGRGLQILGSGIHILLLDVEKGEVTLEGQFHSFKYTGGNVKQSVMKRIFG